jgi:hypothetical protein
MPDAYLGDLATHAGYLIVEPRGGYNFTVLDDGGLAMEFPQSHLAVRLAGPDAFAALGLAIANAQRREAEMEVDDAGLWRPTPPTA